MWGECNFGRDCSLYFDKKCEMFLKITRTRLLSPLAETPWLTHSLVFLAVRAVTLLPTLLMCYSE